MEQEVIVNKLEKNLEKIIEVEMMIIIIISTLFQRYIQMFKEFSIELVHYEF